MSIALRVAVACACVCAACSNHATLRDAAPGESGSPSDAVVDGRVDTGGADALGLDDAELSDSGGGDGKVGPPVGKPVPGCADPSDATLTEDEKFLLNLPADSWASAPNTKLYDACSKLTHHGDGIYLVSGCPAIVSSWSGAALDTKRQKLVVWGGGHNDYGGNEVYAFNLKTFSWEQQTTPSSPPFDKDPLDDGHPVSRHTYDGLAFIAHRGTILAEGGSRSTDGGGTKLTWEYNPEDTSWTNLGPAVPGAPSAYNHAMAYDPVTKVVLLHAQAYLGGYSFDTNTWKKLIDFGYPPYTHHYDGWGARTGAVDPGRRLFVTLGSGSEVLVYDIDAKVVRSPASPWNALGENAPFLTKAAPGIDFDESAQQFVVWAGGSPCELDMSTEPYRWVQRSADGAPATQVGTGTYGRWRYAPHYNVFVLVNDAKANVLFYKHTAGCGE